MLDVQFLGGGVSSLKDFYRDKVLNGGFSTEFAITVYQSRITVNEGKIVIDTTNRIGYLYLDITTLIATTSGDWRLLGSFASGLSSYLPKSTSNNRQTYVALIADETSDHKPCCRVGYASSSSLTALAAGYNETFAVNDHIILYNSWTY